MAGTLHIAMQRVRGDFEWPEPLAHAARHLIDRKTVGRDRVPQTEKTDVRNVASRGHLRGRLDIPAQPLLDLFDDQAPIRVKMLLVIIAVGLSRQPIEFGF